jgi:hypothetical protein
MTRVKRSSDCGNSPKNEFAQEVAIAIEARDAASLTSALAEDATCCVPSGEILERDAFVASFTDAPTPTSIEIDRVVTHGRAGAVDGVSHFGKTEPRRFCHVLHIANAKGDRVAHISSYGDLR